MEKYLLIGLGGFLGSIGRFAISTAVYRTTGESFPYGTLAVNIVGCFLIGLFMTMFQDRLVVQPNLRLFLIIGVLGGFTTFSSFSFETIAQLQGGNIADAAWNSTYSVLGCLAATWVGVLTGKLF